ncbi:MAG: hypothetical protein JWQ83_239 [Lacunisphaera sp.]|nr:hypothetical protein [Lacunisphaera sp.]MDB6165099.1 hypothetical protein [Lacunisphaera sp.]
MLLGCLSLRAQTLFWDINGKTAGAGGTSPAGAWNTTNGNKVWTTDSTGASTGVIWTTGADAVFSASNDATGAYIVTVSGTQNVSSITVQEGRPTLASGVINFSDTSPDINVAAGSILTFGSALTSTGSNGLNLNTTAGNTGTTVFSANTSLTGSVNLAGGTLSLSSTSYTFGTLNITGNSTIDFAGSTTLSVTNLAISAGVTLTIQNWAQAADFFYATNWTGATPDLYNNGNTAPMNQIVFTGNTASRTGWDSYDHQIRPNVPEPRTYGALLLVALTGLFTWRRLVRRSASHAGIPPGF